MNSPTPLAVLLQKQIAEKGALGLDVFMESALTHPDHGYYMRRNPLGRDGDFTTAPELSQIFGELLGLWCADGWARMGQPASPILAELGAGSGVLMADALRAIRTAMPDFARAVNICFVEKSPALMKIQRQACPSAKIFPAFEDLPKAPLFLIANEFFDALPAKRFHRSPQGWREEILALDEKERLALHLAEPQPLPANCAAPADGQSFCFSAAALEMAAKLAAHLRDYGGMALILDFSAKGGRSLQAVRRHQPCPLLEAPGECDIAAPVDFPVLAAIAKKEGVQVHGPVPQGVFLERLGLSLRVEQLAQQDPQKRDGLAAAALRLAHPAFMGSLFEVMCLDASANPPPAGFGS